MSAFMTVNDDSFLNDPPLDDEYDENNDTVQEHRFVTPEDLKYPDDRFCAFCGRYLTNPVHFQIFQIKEKIK